ncbi:MAG: ATP-binding cassette domain-containing protein [Acidimicrobiales bacterium]|nr:ATP-binding cassette domain-containing protein [Acidimicrobiales bacterium]
MSPVVAVDGIHHRYGTKDALAVERLVFEGGSTAVLGPNGSGKTTLLRLLATVAELQTGTIRVDDLDPVDALQRTAIRRRLGYVAQRDGLPPRMRVGALLDYVGALKEIDSARLRRRWTAWALERVDLADVAGERIGSLSGGMQRRLSIAQALLGGPDLLVLDEPLAGLDSEQRAAVSNLFVSLAETSTIICATHHAEELATLCHRVIVVDGGQPVFVGTPATLADQAAGRVWETTAPDHGAVSRAVAPGRFRCVADRIPAGEQAVVPTVADGYLATVRRSA